VLLDREGKGSSPEGKGAAKVYRRTFAIQKDSLVSRLPKGREPPNRYLANPCQIDVTEQYGPTGELTGMLLDQFPAMYMAVFNGGEWEAVVWASPEGFGGYGFAFKKLGAGVVYLMCVHDGVRLLPQNPPHLVEVDHGVSFGGRNYRFERRPTSLRIDGVGPGRPVAHGQTYVLNEWKDHAWHTVSDATAERDFLTFENLQTLWLYRLVRKTDSDTLERPFTIEDGKPRWW
jgi:hypothetical protein